jgi:lantibiotic biosynthesis protein
MDPILDGGLADRAREAIQAIAQHLGQPPTCDQNDVRPHGIEDVSLAGGRAGLAIFYSYLAQAGLADNAQEKASAFLDEAIDAVAAMPMEPSLYGGFTGIAWSMAHLRGLFDMEDDATKAIDGALRDYLSHKPWHRDYDLISGLVGFGVYALEQLPSPLASECLNHVVNRLAEIAQHTPNGIAWFTASALLPDLQRKICPNGYFNLGLAHGVPGVIAFLGRVCALRDKGARSVSAAIRRKARALLDGAVAWLLAQKLVNKSSVFPVWIGRGITPTPTRVAWCYGDLGIAAALFLAARCVNESSWEEEALALARNVAGRPPEQSGVKDCGLCHGAAGVGHLFNRLFQETGETSFKDAARFWFQRTLEMRRPGEGIAGFPMFRRDPDGAERWIAKPGILEGEAGVALALLGAVTDIQPAWDQMMLVSGWAIQR